MSAKVGWEGKDKRHEGGGRKRTGSGLGGGEYTFHNFYSYSMSCESTAGFSSFSLPLPFSSTPGRSLENTRCFCVYVMHTIMIRSCRARRGRPNLAKASQVKWGQAEPSQTKPSQGEPNQPKRTPVRSCSNDSKQSPTRAG